MPLLCAFLTLIAVAASVARADERTRGGSGLFALSLEDALEIRVDVSSGEEIKKPGTYVFSRHELLRLHGHHKATARLTVGQPTSPVVPVLVDGEYFGDFASLAHALRFARDLRSELSRLEVYSGSRARWGSVGDSNLLVNIITVDRSHRSTDDSRDVEVHK